MLILFNFSLSSRHISPRTTTSESPKGAPSFGLRRCALRRPFQAPLQHHFKLHFKLHLRLSDAKQLVRDAAQRFLLTLMQAFSVRDSSLMLGVTRAGFDGSPTFDALGFFDLGWVSMCGFWVIDWSVGLGFWAGGGVVVVAVVG